ncbi:sulfotransferase ssu-1-like [Argiope bruennichi]|uniref:Amine sulfotransferase like protein n=1 Tax=Argiope bruennichi TaxID=94029 RepID=A0A8T0E2F1_ARGBR|nr:sulfotransferase ssu-1-like [Argiope bruennichi]XP_055924258.1 sulfotransferase ssu-1-like [Argiope bruennichi]KAF8764347.1 Amine sulfotransferase like protein [Argiope bruennichi]
MAKVMKRPRYAEMNGILYPEMFSPKCFKEALEYKPERGDVFICTYPKCGTTWMQNVAMYIFRKGKEIENPYEFLKFAPFIDLLGNEGIYGMPRPGAFKTHLPYSHMPFSPEAKYIFVARDPKDCCVSFYYHARNQPGFGFWDGEFDDFFELFMAGELEYNDYFDHLLDWYPHRNDPNVIYTTYEDMKRDIKAIILKLAKFLGQEYIEAIEKDNAVLNSIIQYSGFDYMKKKLSEVYDLKEEECSSQPMYEGLKYMAQFTASLKPPDDLPELQFVRKGIVGDWKNHLSPGQTERLNRKFLEKLKDTEVLQWYPLE